MNWQADTSKAKDLLARLGEDSSDAPPGIALLAAHPDDETIAFGARTPGELPYFGPLKKVPPRLLDQELVFSRLRDRPKEYVQDRMRKRAADLAELLRRDTTHVYVCGLRGMEEGVEASFREICGEHGLDWNAIRARMRETGRYHVETY